MTKNKDKVKEDEVTEDEVKVEEVKEECDLECQKLSRRHEFSGPVRIVLVDTPPGEVCLRFCSAGATAWAVFLLGCTTLMTTISSFDMERGFMQSLHIFLCTIGVHTLLSVGVLTMNHLHGPAMVMSRPGRRIEHAVTQFIAFLYGTVGLWVLSSTNIQMFSTNGLFSRHGSLGVAGFAFHVLAMSAGPLITLFGCEDKRYKQLRNIHAGFGLVALVFFTGTFLTGITKPQMTAWFNRIDGCVVYVLIAFTCTAIVIIFFRPVSRF